jgi:beta-lactam-binding protein with PASTA domain
VGLTESAALDALGAAGLRQGLVRNVDDNNCGHLGIVTDQSPSPGTLVNPGMNVNYGVFTQPPPPFQCP